MGRHSSPRQGPFLLSVAAWFLPWALLAAVGGTAAWVAVDAVGNDDISAAPPTAAPTSPSPETASPSPTLPSPTPAESKTPSPDKTKTEEITLITDGINVQVLNGTSVSDADDRMADRLARLGFRIEAINSSGTAYADTTVFWSFAAARDAAERLAQKFGWVAAERPANLSTQVALHVVVGADEV